MTDRLSTSDLAGGTPGSHPSREADTSVQTRDPKLDGRDADSRMTDRQAADAGFADSDDRDQSMPSSSGSSTSTPRRTSQLANPAATDGAAGFSDGAEPLFPSSEAEGLRTRWVEVQTGFVDEPRNAVEQADSLVAEMMKRLAQVFADERGKLEEQWSRGDDISTEDLRQALRRYRSFMDRLLSV
jgi:hypothetical protein